MDGTAVREVATVAAATRSNDPEVALAAVAALRGLAPPEHVVLGTRGIDLDEVRQKTERTFGPQAVAQATELLLEAFGVNLDELRGAAMAQAQQGTR